jgi:hypothetical protein
MDQARFRKSSKESNPDTIKIIEPGYNESKAISGPGKFKKFFTKYFLEGKIIYENIFSN